MTPAKTIHSTPKMWELWMHLDYDHLHIPLTSKGKFQCYCCETFVRNFWCPFTPSIDFIDETVVQCYVPVVKILS